MTTVELTERELQYPAGDLWEVEAIASGPMHSPYTVVVVRHKDSGLSAILGNSRDTAKMEELRRRVAFDLSSLLNWEFMCKYRLAEKLS